MVEFLWQFVKVFVLPIVNEPFLEHCYFLPSPIYRTKSFSLKLKIIFKNINLQEASYPDWAEFQDTDFTHPV